MLINLTNIFGTLIAKAIEYEKTDGLVCISISIIQSEEKFAMNSIVSTAHTSWKALCIVGVLGFSSVAFAAETDVQPGATDMPTTVPSNQETADSVFAKLDSGKKGYVSLADVTVLPGFDRVFQKSDANHDGKLTLKEFKAAWPAYAGSTGAGSSEGSTTK